ncbi:MAG: hypothetical protein JWO78_1832 [Micavibrio sp.]|nr:hypothetical protein [Micavibrio sp.]
MLDIGWSEILLIGVVSVVVMKPEDIPKAMMGLGRIMRRIQYMKFAMSQQFEDLMKAGDLDELRKVNFEKSRNAPDIDESEGDLEDYNESLTRAPTPVIPAQAGTHDVDTTGPGVHLRGDDTAGEEGEKL